LGREATKEDLVWGEDAPLDGTRLGDIEFLPQEKLDGLVHALAAEADRIAAPVGRVDSIDRLLLSAIGYRRRGSLKLARVLALCDSRTLIGSLRHIKDEGEIELLRRAARATSFVHAQVMNQTLVGRSEREIANFIEAEFMKKGLQWTAYETIVGSGQRSTVLHARAGDRMIVEGEIVLIDAGGEWRGYCADVTRALPSGRRFTPAQRQVYSVVLEAQKLAIAAVAPGRTLGGIHELACNALREGLLALDLKWPNGKPDLNRLMPHGTSHWLGLDVHDPSPHLRDDGSEILLERGMCFTVEPGLYFRESEVAPLGYGGIGVRIEDDVVVGNQKADVLTSAPKEIDEIEALREASLS
jgi:Xaa-Pro aminopeptidase